MKLVIAILIIYYISKISGVYFTMTNIQMNLLIDPETFNSGRALGKLYASNKSGSASSKSIAKTSQHSQMETIQESELIYNVISKEKDLINVSQYSGRIFPGEDLLKVKDKEKRSGNLTVSVSVSDSLSQTDAGTTVSIKTALLDRNKKHHGLDCEEIISDLCYWRSVNYQLYENENNTIIGSIGSSYYLELCTNHTVKYSVKGAPSIDILPPSAEDHAWKLFARTALNREPRRELKQFEQKNRLKPAGDRVQINVKCIVESNTGKKHSLSRNININVLDKNDNVPEAMHNEDINIYLSDDTFKKGDEVKHPKLMFVDNDLYKVNSYVIRILNDTDGLFEPLCGTYDVGHHQSNHTIIHCKLVFKKNTQLKTSPYTVIIQINDTALLDGHGVSHVQLPIHIFTNFVNTTEKLELEEPHKELILYPRREVKIFRTAGPFARVTQPEMPIAHLHSFEIIPANGNGNGGNLSDFCLDVTNTTGIVYVHDVAELRLAAGILRLKVRWHNGSRTETDELILHIQDEPTHTCTEIEADLEKWPFCSQYGNYNKCVNECGLSTGGWKSFKEKLVGGRGRCQWRGEKIPGGTETTAYSTCTPDVDTCPDGICDELEALYPLICPQDCSPDVGLMPIKNKSGLGIKFAAGICTCEETKGACSCNIPKKKNKTTSATTGSNSGSNSSKHIVDDTTGLHYNSSKHTDHYPQTISADGRTHPVNTATSTLCGPTCMIALSAGAVFALISVAVTALCWRLGSRGGAKARGRAKCESGTGQVVLGRTNMGASVQSMDGRVAVGNYMTTAGGGHSPGENGMNINFEMTSTLERAMGMHRHRLVPPADPKWEFPRNQLTIEQTLGEGEFGRVLRAKAKDIAGYEGFTIVAVKTLKEDARDAELADLLSEYELLKDVAHPNVIRLLGASTKPGGPIYLIMEFAQFGSLRSYIRRSRHLKSESNMPASDRLSSVSSSSSSVLGQQLHYDQPRNPDIISAKDILSFAWQISKGMTYLTDIKLVHRDLAARNVLVATGKICKISDFGLTRDVYEDDAYFKRSKGRVPVKWMAPESLSDHIYTTKSDIWSFGILIWELVTLGATPYPGVPVQNLFHLLRSGYRMERPENCSQEVYKIMRNCWDIDPNLRPTFAELSVNWEHLLEKDIDYLDLTPNAIHNRSYFCSILEDNENNTLTTANFTGKNTDDELSNLAENLDDSPKYDGTSTKLLSPSLADTSSSPLLPATSPTPQQHDYNNTILHKKTNNGEEDHQALLRSSEDELLPIIIPEGCSSSYESPVKIRQKTVGSCTPTNENPHYYTDMTSGGSDGKAATVTGTGESMGLLNGNG